MSSVAFDLLCNARIRCVCVCQPKLPIPPASPKNICKAVSRFLWKPWLPYKATAPRPAKDSWKGLTK